MDIICPNHKMEGPHKLKNGKDIYVCGTCGLELYGTWNEKMKMVVFSYGDEPRGLQ